MPNVGGKEYPYTAKGMAMAKMAAKPGTGTGCQMAQ
jgi:hypothetical protein